MAETQGTKSVAEITDWIRSNTGHIKQDEEPKTWTETWVLDAYRESQANKKKKTTTHRKCETTQEKGGNTQGVRKAVRKLRVMISEITRDHHQ